MAITNGYLSLEEARSLLNVSDTTDDPHIELAVEAASRAIDDWCGRHFYKADETRYFTAQNAHSVEVDDLVTITTLKTDEGSDGTYERTWEADDYVLEPFNAATDGKPYQTIRTSTNGSYTFPAYRRSIEIVGSFGWPAVPPAVKQACAIQANVIVRQATEGAAPIVTMDGATLGSSMYLDRTVQLLLRSYRIYAVA